MARNMKKLLGFFNLSFPRLVVSEVEPKREFGVKSHLFHGFLGIKPSILISLVSFVFPAVAFAQNITDTAGVHAEICNVFDWMFWVLISVSMIMILWAAYMYATAAGDEEQASQAKRAIFYAAIGVAVALLARGFPLLVGSIFPGGTRGVSGC